MIFTEYLQQKRLAAGTVRTYTKRSHYFLAWLQREGLTAESFGYNDLLGFMRHCSAEGVSKKETHALLGTVRHYSNWLIKEGRRNDSPAAGIFIKGLVRKLPGNLLTMDEMEELYKQYSIQLNVDASKKIMLGLLVYQGITVGELMRLQSHHFRLKDGKVFIKAGAHSNERLLNLEAVQITELQGYLSKKKSEEGALFIEQRQKRVSGTNINNRVQWMFGQLKQLNPAVINAKQIRSSLITHWLKQHGLRQVQYMAGHKYASSTERYQLNNLDGLQNELQHHPMQ